MHCRLEQCSEGKGNESGGNFGDESRVEVIFERKFERKCVSSRLESRKNKVQTESAYS